MYRMIHLFKILGKIYNLLLCIYFLCSASFHRKKGILMKELKDDALIAYYIRENNIMSWFETKDLDFRLVQYEPGELINVLHPAHEYLKFLVKGILSGYVVNEDGSQYQYYNGSSIGPWGNVEFCGYIYTDHIQEAQTPLHCLELYVPRHRELLLQDRTFLWKLATSIARTSYYYGAHQQYNALPLRTKVVNYLNLYCPDRSFTGVETLCNKMHCSRSQMQKVLRQMIEDGELRKEGKGKYCLLTGTTPEDIL